MVATVLPLYLVSTLGFTPLQYGIVDGLYQGAAAFVRLAGGFIGDRRRKHKGVATFGYGLSAVCKLALAAVGSAFGAISAIIVFDRAGKGLRTAPRDAMISMSSREEDLGASFGIHRALDTTGALLGPLVAFGLLALAPGAFDSLFLVSFCFAAAGVGVIVLLVREPARKEPAAPKDPVRLRDAFALLRGPRFRGLFVAATALGLATASDGFIYLLLQRQLDLDPMLFPLLFTGTAATFMLLAAPVGRLADRIGRGRVMLGGYVLLLGVYVTLLGPSTGIAGLFVALFMLGAYYAATDGVLMALGSGLVTEDLRGSGLALLGTGVSLSRLRRVDRLRRAVDAGGHPGRPGRLRRRARGRRCCSPASPCGAPGHERPGDRLRRALRGLPGRRRRRRRRRGAAHPRRRACVRARGGQGPADRHAPALRRATPFVLVRDLDRDDAANYGRLALAPLEGGRPGALLLAGETCERVDFAAGHGLCLGTADPTGFKAKVLDGQLRKVGSVKLAGVPSRTRVSPDGRYGGVTSFVTGHSYADVGQFSTAATIIDLERGKKFADLEKDFTITLHGKPATARDRNFWGITFSRDGDTFYATMATGGKTYLIKNSLRRRTGTAIHENVECPALSPDETRIGYKKAVGHDPPVWRFHVLDLATGRETPLAEQEPLDDQIEWLDDDHVLYRSGESTWTMPADGSGKPERWLAGADSPAVVRG